MKIKIINGPNLNMLGIREKGVYGLQSYEDLVKMLNDYALAKNIELDIVQTNEEGKIITEIQNVYFNHYDALIINPGAYTHYSYAIRDALVILSCPVVEVHISDIYHREAFRSINVIKDVISRSVIGKGLSGYIEALNYIIDKN